MVVVVVGMMVGWDCGGRLGLFGDDGEMRGGKGS